MSLPVSQHHSKRVCMCQNDSTCIWSEALSGSSSAAPSLTPIYSVVCRKGRTPYHEISKLTGKEKFYCWDWVKFWKYHHTPQQAVSWWIAWCFLFGSVFFLMAACSSLSHKVNSSHCCRHLLLFGPKKLLHYYYCLHRWSCDQWLANK